MAKQYHKPDGSITEDPDEYISSWKNFSHIIEMFTGTELYGFDPGIALRRKGTDETICLPTWFVEMFNHNIADEFLKVWE